MTEKEYVRPRMLSREELEQALIEANEQLSQANERLLRQEQERAALFSNLSHDLRAPMAALTSSVALLREKPDISGAEYQELLDLMSRRLKSLNAILDDIFLLGRMEAPDLVLKRETIEAAPLLEEFFYSCEADSRFQDRMLKLDLEEGMDCRIFVDPEKIVRVLDNLFTNALRYSEAGAEIALCARVISAGRGNKANGGGRTERKSGGNGPARKKKTARKLLQISVRDTGLGISEADLPHIFERSFRGDRSRTPGIDGYGLGLSIAKSITERHGGEIRCESEEGEGSVFTIELPIV